ncbi:hypothetical protein [Nakamurella aerolata]|uniref:Uncharacterized protein n=1 Tax=Nakamurella aerolata TaxID=1656892 RepID=A0A849A8N3_9ACTN|nr:hypothetical protein [Nakamurella aerolata]NNG35883.1 hypothetical protein [Nakamurella aerolata]
MNGFGFAVGLAPALAPPAVELAGLELAGLELAGLDDVAAGAVDSWAAALLAVPAGLSDAAADACDGSAPGVASAALDSAAAPGIDSAASDAVAPAACVDCSGDDSIEGDGIEGDGIVLDVVGVPVVASADDVAPPEVSLLQAAVSRPMAPSTATDVFRRDFRLDFRGAGVGRVMRPP